MTKNNFMEQLTCELTRFFPKEKYNLTSKVHVKNNDTRLFGISICDIKLKAGPTVYIDGFYDEYCRDGTSIYDFAKRIYDMIKGRDWDKYGAAAMESMDLDHCRDKIIYRLVSKRENSMYLMDTPYIPFLDLAIVFFVVHRLSDTGMESIRITYPLFESWNISKKELYEIAMVNTRRILPPRLYSMLDMMRYLCGDIPTDLEDTLDIVECYVATNKYKIDGATTLLYEGWLQARAEEHQCNFFILPSSIHEVLLVPDNCHQDLSDFNKMVKEVNSVILGKEEYLSDHAYYYDRTERKFIL